MLAAYLSFFLQVKRTLMISCLHARKRFTGMSTISAMMLSLPDGVTSSVNDRLSMLLGTGTGLKCTQRKPYSTRSPAVARIADCTGCQWPLRASKIDDFFVIWKPICDFLSISHRLATIARNGLQGHPICQGACHFLLVINSNLVRISHRFRNTATYSLKHSIENCGQTAADWDMVTIKSL